MDNPGSDASGQTAALARFLAAKGPALPEAVRAEAVRTALNWMGCAVGAAGHKAARAALAATRPFAGAAQAQILGGSERTDVQTATLVNGIAGHVLDFDDTHPDTLIHPSGPVLPALVALAEHRAASGAALLEALVFGIEAECRIGRTVLPSHYEVGWHITGTAGVFGAAAACGRLLGLDAERMAWALGLAATQPVGLRDMFGSMTKSFHPARAAQNGLLAALLAEQGYTASPRALEAKRGWAAAVSDGADLSGLLSGLGERWEIMQNTYKPFACGLVAHPGIDGALRLRAAHGVEASQVEAVELLVHGLTLELTAKPTPRTGLDGKFSVQHGVAVALLHGRAGEAEFSDASVLDEATVALRDRVRVALGPGLAKDQAEVTLVLRSGKRLQCRVEHAVGGLETPMSDAALDEKFLSLATRRLAGDQAQRLLEACRALPGAADAGSVARLEAAACVPY